MTRSLAPVDQWHTMTVDDAWLTNTVNSVRQLYASPRGHAVTSIKYVKPWYIVTYSSGGKRYVKGDRLLYYKVTDGR